MYVCVCGCILSTWLILQFKQAESHYYMWRCNPIQQRDTVKKQESLRMVRRWLPITPLPWCWCWCANSYESPEDRCWVSGGLAWASCVRFTAPRQQHTGWHTKQGLCVYSVWSFQVMFHKSTLVEMFSLGCSHSQIWQKYQPVLSRIIFPCLLSRFIPQIVLTNEWTRLFL